MYMFIIILIIIQLINEFNFKVSNIQFKRFNYLGNANVYLNHKNVIRLKYELYKYIKMILYRYIHMQGYNIIVNYNLISGLQWDNNKIVRYRLTDI